ncbi:MAG: radical SAM protein [Pseudomonadota bacterium]
MNILLIQPPVQDFYQTEIRTQPLGLAYLAAALQQHSHAVTILDCQVPGRKKQLPLPAIFAYMKEYYDEKDMSPFRLYSKYFHFGLSYKEISAYIKNCSPGAVGISCQFTPYVQETIKIAALVKELSPGIPVIVGGAHASSLPEEILKIPSIDYVVIGEGEGVLPKLIHHIESDKIPWELDSIGFKADGAMHINPRKNFIEDLDSLAFPARHLFDCSCYRIDGRPCTMLLTSRGCPQNCAYCSVQNVMGKQLRVRSPENILREMRWCREEYGISLFDIEDDNFTFDAKRAITLLSLIIDEFGKEEIKLFAMNGLSIISLNKALLEMMQRAGFQHLDLSLGSSVIEANKNMDRPCDPAASAEVLKQAASLQFAVTTYIILGLPGQGLEEMIDSLLYVMEKETYVGPSIFYPSPGTKIYQDIYKDTPADYSVLRSSVFPVETDIFSRLDIVTLLRLARWINFIKRRLLYNTIPEISFDALLQESKAAWWAKGIPENFADAPESFFHRSLPKPFTPEESGALLTALFLHWGTFFGIRRLRKRNKELYTYRIFPYKTSARAIELFMERGKALTIKAAVTKSTKRNAGRQQHSCLHSPKINT